MTRFKKTGLPITEIVTGKILCRDMWMTADEIYRSLTHNCPAFVDYDLHTLKANLCLMEVKKLVTSKWTTVHNSHHRAKCKAYKLP